MYVSHFHLASISAGEKLGVVKHLLKLRIRLHFLTVCERSEHDVELYRPVPSKVYRLPTSLRQPGRLKRPPLI